MSQLNLIDRLILGSAPNTPATLNRILHLVDEGWTCAEVGGELGLTEAAVWMRIARHRRAKGGKA